MRGDGPVFVLVHSPLVGPLTWTRVTDSLRRRGHRVVMPRLDNPDDPSPSLQRHHAERIRRSVEADAGSDPIVLVAHSGAAAVLPIAGETLVNEVVAYVIVDGDLPHDGATRLDSAPPEFAVQLRRLVDDQGRLPPWAEWWDDDVLTALLDDDELQRAFLDELEPLPARLFEEPIRVPPQWPDAPCAYLRLSEAYDDAATAAARRGWEVVTFEAGHLHMLVDPDSVADALTEVTDDLARPGRPARASGATTAAGDPVLARRHRIAGWVDLGRRVGFLSLAVALFLFAVALYWGLPSILVTLVITSLVVGGLTLLPAIIAGYGIAAAEREDAEREGRGPPGPGGAPRR